MFELHLMHEVLLKTQHGLPVVDQQVAEKSNPSSINAPGGRLGWEGFLGSVCIHTLAKTGLETSKRS